MNFFFDFSESKNDAGRSDAPCIIFDACYHVFNVQSQRLDEFTAFIIVPPCATSKKFPPFSAFSLKFSLPFRNLFLNLQRQRVTGNAEVRPASVCQRVQQYFWGVRRFNTSPPFFDLKM